MSPEAKYLRLQELTGQRCISSIGSVNRLNSEDALTPYEVASLVAYAKLASEKEDANENLAKTILELVLELERNFKDDNSLPKEVRGDIYSYIDSQIHERLAERSALAKVGLAKEMFEALYLRLWMRDRCLYSMKLLLNLRIVLKQLAAKHIEVLMPVYSHLQPIKSDSLSKWWLASFYRFKRDFDRLNECFNRINICPLSGQYEFNSHTNNFRFEDSVYMETFGFNSVSENSLDSITDFDSIIELTTSASVIGVHLSQLANELSIWSSWEFGYVRLPRKPLQSEIYGEIGKNPLKLLRQRCSMFSGDLMNVLLEQKGHHVSYSQELRGLIPGMVQVFGNLEFVLELAAMVLPVMIFDTKKMEEQANIDLANSGGIFDYLVERSYEPDKARKITASLLEYCKQRKKHFIDLTLGEWQEFSPGFDKEVYQYLFHQSPNLDSTGGQLAIHQMNLESKIEGLQVHIESDAKILETRLAKFLNNPCEDGQSDN